METIFLTQPRTFQDTDNTTFEIVGISGKIHQQEENYVGNLLQIMFEIKFWKKDENGTWLVEDSKIAPLQKEYDIPNMGKIPVLSGLFSNDPTTVYQMASIVCAYYGYTLKPFEDQEYLIANMNN